MNSCIYEGQVQHRRFEPVDHRFGYALHMLLVDLDELEEVFRCHPLWSVNRWNVACFLRRDYLGDPQVSLRQAVAQRVKQACGAEPQGAVRVLTHLRYWGYCFNPVTFYYCYDRGGDHVETVVAEITNTPWNERHAYVLGRRHNIGSPQSQRFRFAKEFHISPFMDMDLQYDWRFTEPGESLGVHMENLLDGRRLFDASMTMRRRAISRAALTRVLLRYPFMTAKVMAAIYYQALRLRWKRAPFYEHPAKRRLPVESVR